MKNRQTDISEMSTAMLPKRLLDSPIFLMISLVREGRQQSLVKNRRIRIPQYAVLTSLYEFGPASQKSISERIRFDASDLVSVLDALEEDGLISRQVDPDDRRRHQLTLTTQGKKQLLAIEQDILESSKNFLRGLSQDEQDTLKKLLIKALSIHDSRVK